MDNFTIPEKICTKCHQNLPATTEFFYKKKNGLYGLFSWCKVCHNRMTTPPATRWNKEHPERVRANSRRYAQNNPQKVSNAKLRWQSSNPQKTAIATKKYRKANSHKTKVIAHRYRARKRSLPDTFTPQEWLACLGYFNYTCCVCGAQLRDLFGNVEPHADHWIPIASELCTGTIATNMVCLCNSCNRSKHAKLPEQWLEQKYGAKKAKAILARVNAYFDSLK
jgi:5-methylcytosine-specific restriction endonuclease McrA